MISVRVRRSAGVSCANCGNQSNVFLWLGAAPASVSAIEAVLSERRHAAAHRLRCINMLTVLLFRFPFPGPWGKELTQAARDLAHDIATEPGLVWLEDRAAGHAGGIYLFEDAAAAERYREKHERRLAAMGLVGVTANAFSVNSELSVLTMAAAALRGGPSMLPQTAAP